MGEAELQKSVRTVYQKDLYEENYSLNVRIPSDELDDGDRLKVTVEKIDNTRTESDSNSQTQKDLRTRVRYRISKVVNGFVIWLMEKHYGL